MAKAVFYFSAALSVVAVFLISWFVFRHSIPAIKEIGLGHFLFGAVWSPTNGQYGILPMIAASVVVTSGAVLIGVPVGILSAVYLAYYCPTKMKPFFRVGINLLSGIPSVVYGLWALEGIVPAIRRMFGGFGLSILAGILLLGVMILPTIIALTQAALTAVPEHYFMGAIALGASRERAIFSVVLPAARSGVFAAVILGIGRAVGETMAVQMVIGNMALMPSSLIKGARTLTTNIVMEMAYAPDGVHRSALIATGAVLFVFILLLNSVLQWIRSKRGVRR
ncbi:MAG: phosphate ABC transporter permease subunit PstC [Ndongobacter sp.]|nr:phosphate ABC transporter permease subunit PstC [Ndongobacter sp.]